MSTEQVYYGIDMPATGEHIRTLRTSSGMSVREVQHRVGLEAPQSVYRWERGETVPKLENLKGLSVLFDRHIEDLIIWTKS